MFIVKNSEADSDEFNKISSLGGIIIKENIGIIMYRKHFKGANPF